MLRAHRTKVRLTFVETTRMSQTAVGALEDLGTRKGCVWQRRLAAAHGFWQGRLIELPYPCIDCSGVQLLGGTRMRALRVYGCIHR